MLLGTLGATLLGNVLTGKVQLEQVKKKLKQLEIVNATPSFN